MRAIKIGINVRAELERIAKRHFILLEKVQKVSISFPMSQRMKTRCFYDLIRCRSAGVFYCTTSSLLIPLFMSRGRLEFLNNEDEMKGLLVSLSPLFSANASIIITEERKERIFFRGFKHFFFVISHSSSPPGVF